MNEIDILKPVIDGHIIYFGLKYKNKKNWYPKNTKDIDEFLVDFFKTHPHTKKIKDEVNRFIKEKINGNNSIPILSGSYELYKKRNKIYVMVSSKETVKTCLDKLNFYKNFRCIIF